MASSQHHYLAHTSKVTDNGIPNNRKAPLSTLLNASSIISDWRDLSTKVGTWQLQAFRSRPQGTTGQSAFLHPKVTIRRADSGGRLVWEARSPTWLEEQLGTEVRTQFLIWELWYNGVFNLGRIFHTKSFLIFLISPLSLKIGNQPLDIW